MQSFLWYNVLMSKKHTITGYYTAYQLKLPVDIEKVIEISDPVYTFCDVMNHINLKKYLAFKESRVGRKRYDSETLLKVILFAFMEFGYVSVREIVKLCKNDIRFMWLLRDNSVPSHMTVDNFMNNCLSTNIADIFAEINDYIFSAENVIIYLCEKNRNTRFFVCPGFRWTVFLQPLLVETMRLELTTSTMRM